MNQESSSPRLRAAFRTGIVLFFSGSLVALLVSYSDFGGILEALSTVTPSTIAVASFAIGSGLLITAIRWWVFMRRARFPNGLGQIIAVRFIGHFFNTILPSGMAGDVVQVFLVVRRPRTSATHALSATLADRLVGLGGIIFLLVVSLPWVGFQWSEVYWIAPAAVGLFILGLLILSGLGRIRPHGRSWKGVALNFFIVLIRRASLSEKGVKLVAVTTLISVVAQIAITIAPWILIREMVSVPFLFSLPVLALVSLSTLVPVTVGGLGIREWILFGAMSSFGLSLEAAIAVSITWFAVTVAVSAVLASISFVLLALTSGLPGRRSLVLARVLSRAGPSL